MRDDLSRLTAAAVLADHLALYVAFNNGYGIA